jgi:hypothetical protein
MSLTRRAISAILASFPFAKCIASEARLQQYFVRVPVGTFGCSESIAVRRLHLVLEKQSRDGWKVFETTDGRRIFHSHDGYHLYLIKFTTEQETIDLYRQVREEAV